MMNYTDEYALILKDKKNFEHLPQEVRSDKEFIKECLRLPSFLIQLKHIKPELKEDRDFIKELIVINNMALVYAAPILQEDKGLIYMSYLYDKNKKDPLIFDFVSNEIKSVYQNNPEKLIDDYEREQLKIKLDENLVLHNINIKKPKI